MVVGVAGTHRNLFSKNINHFPALNDEIKNGLYYFVQFSFYCTELLYTLYKVAGKRW
jgi:hypothetical protein